MKKLHVGCSPLTKTIYCGHVLKDGQTWAANRSDVTGEALGAVIEKIGAGNIQVVTVNGVPRFEIEVRELK